MDAAATLGALAAARFSCRGFLDRPVPRAAITHILTLAQRTASWCNAQPWQVIVTSGAATERLRAALLAHAETAPPAPDFPWPSAYHGVYQARRRECGFQLYESVGVARGDRAAARRQALENYRLFGAPHCALITSDAALGVYGAIDCGAYVGNFMLAARALGIDCIAQAALAAYPEFLRDHFGLPRERLIVCGISFGYADPAHPANRFRTTRAAIAEVARFVEE
uniref:Nitroreductase n=1 Tax=Acidicaldus sp. TaxID=1872105 RepID=A0A8J4HFL2_9PROT